VPSSAPPDLSGLTLLVVDDNDDALDVLCTLLRSCGARVMEARNGATALAYIDLHPSIDAVVTDLSMPFMDGVELVRQLRQRRSMRPLPAIAVTGFYENYMDTAGAAFDAFMRKPVNFDDLCRTIRTLAKTGDDPNADHSSR
jgi:two-component system, chemotaxis family, CheB/CheR fusion protein